MATTEAQQKSNKYRNFEQTIKEQSEEWSHHTPFDAEPGSREIYVQLEQLIVQQAIIHMEDPPEDWVKGAFEAPQVFGRTKGLASVGLRVMLFHIYEAACAAGYREVPILIEKLAYALRSPRSFEPLAELTKTTKKPASRVEKMQGLSYFSSPDGLHFVREGYYDIVNGAVVMPRLMEDIEAQPESRWLTEKKINCHAYNVLADIYQHLVEICLKDARFAASSLVIAMNTFKPRDRESGLKDTSPY